MVGRRQDGVAWTTYPIALHSQTTSQLKLHLREKKKTFYLVQVAIPCGGSGGIYVLSLIFIYIFVYLSLSCCKWDVVPDQGWNPGPTIGSTES